MRPPALSWQYATELIAACIRHGVRELVVCPGSRSQALALAAAHAERAGAVRLHVRVDERSAGFFALGIARESGLPAPVIVTSGSAVANLLPAALEAHESRVPMLLLTADRPALLRGTRSNQTTRQAGLFAECSRLALDIDTAQAFEAAAGTVSLHDPTTVAACAMVAAGGRADLPPGPVQLNLQFHEPLTSAVESLQRPPEEVFAAAAQDREAGAGLSNPSCAGERAAKQQAPTADAVSYLHEGDARAVVIAGESAGPEAEAFAVAAGLPLLAEVVSGARFGCAAIAGYASLIDDAQTGALIERAIVFGRPTLTRQVPALLQRDDVEVIVIDPHCSEQVDHFDPSGAAAVVASAHVSKTHDPGGMNRWLERWIVADRALREARSTARALETAAATGHNERTASAKLAAAQEPVTRELLAESLWRASLPQDRLVLAASRLVRVLDAIAEPRRVQVRANRGLAGIDGTVATALGIAASHQGEGQPPGRAGVTRVLLGDLALLHDAGSLLLPEAEPRPRVQLFVGNDGGGTIFDTLEAAQLADAGAFDRVMYTPQRADLEALARAYGWQYRLVRTRGALEQLLTEQAPNPQLVEVPLAR